MPRSSTAIIWPTLSIYGSVLLSMILKCFYNFDDLANKGWSYQNQSVLLKESIRKIILHDEYQKHMFIDIWFQLNYTKVYGL